MYINAGNEETQHDELAHAYINFVTKTCIFGSLIALGLVANIYILAVLQYFQVAICTSFLLHIHVETNIHMTNKLIIVRGVTFEWKETQNSGVLKSIYLLDNGYISSGKYLLTS